ncbi:hypothetical protein [Tellurirhabdus bombi]|uniref:hypothetical protein n=1 Tax=Tellurirhabdus bombi TaxID=2907205 RepID=UPI001F442C7D|nr:hypothetical protein [Tellurirhabdus bombi]
MIDDPQDARWTDTTSAAIVRTVEIDSTAIYRCDSCAFAKKYNQGAPKMYVRNCRSCDWRMMNKAKPHNVGDLPQPDNPPANAILEKHNDIERFQEEVAEEIAQSKQPQDDGF